MQVSISSITIPPGHNLKGAKTLPRDNYCVQKPSPRDRTGSQNPHSRDIKLENFTNTNSDNMWNEKLCGLNKLNGFPMRRLIIKVYISFGSHQSQTIECMKALYDMYKCMLIIFWEKGAWNFTKNISNFCQFLLSFFIVSFFFVIKYSTSANQLSTEQ